MRKLAHRLIIRSDRIALDDLRITTMARNQRPATSILDAGWGCRIRRLTRTAAETVRMALPGDPRITSSTWSRRRHGFESRALSDRRMDCDRGRSLDRDHTAAVTILNRSGHVRWVIRSPGGGLPYEAAPL